MPSMSFVAKLDAAWYPGYSRTWDNERYREYVLPHVRPTHHMLDLGAGRGRIPEMNFRGLAAEVTGADPDPCVLENAYLDRAVELRGAGPLPFHDSAFDIVVTSNVLEHIDDPALFFREVGRVLKPGGLFFGKTPNRWHYVAMIASVTPHRFHEWVNARRGRGENDTYPTRYRVNSRAAIQRVARATGLHLVDLSSWEGPPNYLRIAPPLYPVGIAYERLVNATEALGALRAVLAMTLRKPV